MTDTQWPVVEVTKLPDDFTIHAAQGFINVRGPEFYAARLVDQAVTKVMAARHETKPTPTTNPKEGITMPNDAIIVDAKSTAYQANRPLRSLPARMNEAACLAILKRIDPEVKVDSVAAARSTVTVEGLDQALEYTELSIGDRFLLKSSLVEHGILARGVRTSLRKL
jgi:hypothetical protein